MRDYTLAEGWAHARRFLTRHAVTGASSTDDGIRFGFELAMSILARPRCVECTYEINPAAGVCFRCGTPQRKET